MLINSMETAIPILLFHVRCESVNMKALVVTHVSIRLVFEVHRAAIVLNVWQYTPHSANGEVTLDHMISRA